VRPSARTRSKEKRSLALLLVSSGGVERDPDVDPTGRLGTIREISASEE